MAEHSFAVRNQEKNALINIHRGPDILNDVNMHFLPHQYQVLKGKNRQHTTLYLYEDLLFLVAGLSHGLCPPY